MLVEQHEGPRKKHKGCVVDSEWWLYSCEKLATHVGTPVGVKGAWPGENDAGTDCCRCQYGNPGPGRVG